MAHSVPPTGTVPVFSVASTACMWIGSRVSGARPEALYRLVLPLPPPPRRPSLHDARRRVPRGRAARRRRRCPGHQRHGGAAQSGLAAAAEPHRLGRAAAALRRLLDHDHAQLRDARPGHRALHYLRRRHRRRGPLRRPTRAAGLRRLGRRDARRLDRLLLHARHHAGRRRRGDRAVRLRRHVRARVLHAACAPRSPPAQLPAPPTSPHPTPPQLAAPAHPGTAFFHRA